MFTSRFGQDTEPFWNAVRQGLITIIVSDVLVDEIEKAPKIVRSFFDSLSESCMEQVIATEEAKELATQYIAEKVVGETSFDDCVHIALATIHRADYLVSWNFKHIVNVDRIRGYNSVNMKLGYQQIEIRTPYEIINDES